VPNNATNNRTNLKRKIDVANEPQEFTLGTRAAGVSRKTATATTKTRVGTVGGATSVLKKATGTSTSVPDFLGNKPVVRTTRTARPPAASARPGKVPAKAESKEAVSKDQQNTSVSIPPAKKKRAAYDVKVFLF
jgi:hypothetical protein